ncbi:diacylglycerol O-acyltransferase 1-like [Dermatophagoides pteronyssinus]|uniref:diacylglycerol O-acyltransferase 1-like n=1 Tax=Dermatophagoides pteronyssinus TaxID=6956 RepID=UPI003F668A04
MDVNSGDNNNTNSSSMNTTIRRRERKRSQSLTNENHLYEIIRMNQPDKPIHQYRDSLFSSSSGFNNFRGFFTLALILLVLATLRVALENVIKYGILINYSQIFWLFFGHTSIWPTIISSSLLNLFIYCSYWIEKRLSKNQINPNKATYIIWINLTSVLLWPIVAVFIIPTHVVAASAFSFMYLAVWLKLYSYHSVNYWCRLHQKKTHKRHNSGDSRQWNNHQHSGQNEHHTDVINKQLVQYPYNLNISDIYYFIFVPTLCYELNFPRTERIRKRFLFKRLFEVIFLTQLILALIQQWMVPTIHNSLRPLQEMDYFRMLERLLKLSIPNHVIWLIWFYTYFHSFLNLIGEILCFGDRQFYKDWWNAESLQYFWKNWNIPVHHWCLRHVYVPLLKRGYSKITVTTIVFLMSAVFHEYLVSVPLRMFRFWAFTGMAMQIPFVFVIHTGFFQGHYANMFVWFSLIIGQPLCILACYHDYYVVHHALT